MLYFSNIMVTMSYNMNLIFYFYLTKIIVSRLNSSSVSYVSADRNIAATLIDRILGYCDAGRHHVTLLYWLTGDVWATRPMGR